ISNWNSAYQVRIAVPNSVPNCSDIIQFPETTPLACENLTLTQIGSTSNSRTYSLGPDPEELRDQLTYTITPNPTTTRGLERLPAPDQDILKDFARPTVRFTTDKNQLRVENPSQYYNISVQVTG